jgi:hypothetical protein
MGESEAIPGDERGTARWRPDTPARAALLAALVALGLEAAHLAAALCFVDVRGDGWLLGRGSYRVGAVVSLLSGFTLAAVAYGSLAERRTLARRRRELGWSEERFAAFASPWYPRPGRALLWALALAPAGVLLVTASDANRPFVFTDDPWTPSIAWAFVSNTVLFALLGSAAHYTRGWRRVERAFEAHTAPLDLLDPSPERRLASAGLRRSFFWLVGSSIGSLVLLDLDFSWMTIAVLVVTLAIGTALFLGPLLRLARRIRRAKDDELARVRARIRVARDGVLGPQPGSAVASELPALLAYEQRIAEVRPFALDAFQILRFASLVALALGSWLGGAVVDLLVERSLR